MSSEAVGWVFRHSPYQGAVFAVHLAIADSVNDQGDYEFWMRQRQCADKARVGRQAVNAAISRMVADGLLDLLIEGRGGANRYRFLMPSDTPAKLANAATKVSPQTTPTTPKGVATDDNPVAHDDMGVSPTTTRVSPQATGGVAVDDTEPKRTQDKPKTSSPEPSQRDHSPADPTADDDVDPRIEEALRLVAERSVANQQGVRNPKAYLAQAVANTRNELGDRAVTLAAAHTTWTATQIAAEIANLGPADPLEKTARAARALAEKDRSCPDCGGSGMRETQPGSAVRCDHRGAA